MIRRRLYAEIRVSSLAVWSKRIALFALPVTFLAVLLHRLGAIEYEVAYLLLAAGLAVALTGMLFAVAAFIKIWNEGLRGLGSALAAFVVAAAMLAYPVFDSLRSINLPPISDITIASRIGSIGGFVTCAKSCLK